MKKFILLLAAMLLGLMSYGANIYAGGFDLETGVSVPNPNPAIYTNVPVTVTAKNTGGMPGVDIQIRVGVCGTAAFSFVQGNQLVWANTGSTATGTWDYLNQRWTIPSLAPGQTATLTFTLFTLTTEARGIQVFTQSAGTPDVDSSPGNLPVSNGLWVCTDNEDDEAVITLNGGAVPCVITAGVSNIQCHDNGTPANPADDKFSFSLTAANPAASTGYGVFIAQTSQFFQGTYGSPLTIQNVPISTGNLTVNLTDNVTGGCSASVTVMAPSPCSGGQLPDFNLVSFFAVQPVSGGGSAVVNPNDPVPVGTTLNIPDHFANLSFPVILPQFTVAINAYLSTDAVVDGSDVLVIAGSREITASAQSFGFTEGGIGTGAIPVNTQPGNYFLILKYDATNVLAESNESNNTKSVPIVVTAAPSGSIDLSLKMFQQTANPVIYSHYLTTLEIRNDGQQTATGVKVKWMKPTGVVYTGGNEYVASKGSFNPNGDQVWTVGSLPAGGVESLTVSYFLLQNGAPVTYAQVMAANETDVDSQPNNGTPPTPNEDDEAASGGSAPPVLTPDLTISNLVINNSPIQPGQVLTYNFDLANIGNGNASADFTVKAWISTQSYFNTNGIQDGVVPTGNFIAGFSVSGVPGSSTIPANLTSGQYYLHLWVDAGQVIAESNETNNYASKPFLVQALPLPGVCDELMGPGAIVCTGKNAAGNLTVQYRDNTSLFIAEFNAAGEVVSNQNMGAAWGSDYYSVNGNNLVKSNGSGQVYSKPIPAVLLGQYDRFLNFTEYNGGYLLFAVKNNTVFALRTNAALAVQQTASLGLVFSNIQYLSIYSPHQVNASQVAFTYQASPGVPGQGSLRLAVIDGGTLGILSDVVRASNYFAGGGSLSNDPCGSFTLRSSFALNFCVHGSCHSRKDEQGHFTNGQFVVDNSFYEDEVSAYGFGTRNYVWTLRNADGSLVTGTMTQQVPINPNPPNNVIHLQKTLNGAVLWTKDVTVASAASVRRLGYSGNELVFLSEKNNAVFVETLTCLEGTPPPPAGCAAITITPGPGQIAIAGATAPHVLIKVFKPNWTLAFQCLDNCPNPLVVNGLTTGAHPIQVKLLDAGWNEICYLEQTVDVPAGPSPLALPALKGRAVQLKAVYPNPVYFGEMTVEIWSKEDGEHELEAYDLFGRLVFSQKITLLEGLNEVKMNVTDFRSGTYYLNMPCENWKYMPVRFVVARW